MPTLPLCMPATLTLPLGDPKTTFSTGAPSFVACEVARLAGALLIRLWADVKIGERRSTTTVDITGRVFFILFSGTLQNRQRIQDVRCSIAQVKKEIQLRRS